MTRSWFGWLRPAGAVALVSRKGAWPLFLAVGLALGAAVHAGGPGAPGSQPPVLRLATTTSTADTGLLTALLPAFEQRCRCRVDVIAVGTGQALALGRQGDVDVVLVHARKAEDQFVAEGHASVRYDVMYNDFVIVGPADDPARVAGMATAKEAFGAIARAGAPFASRGDKSGTHTVELGIWAEMKTTPAGAWYRSVGQGMGETLMAAHEMGAYTLSDRATWLATRARVPRLKQMVGGAKLSENRDRTLLNYYGVLPVSPAKHPGVRAALGTMFAEWITAAETQRSIGGFGVSTFGQPLFYPDSDDFKATRALTVKAGATARTFNLADLQALPRVTVANYSVIGAKKGVLGPFTWTGASLKDVLLTVDPALAQPRHAGSRIVVRSSDDWTVTLWWEEIFGKMPKGFALYNVKGCNECHGAAGEGTAPTGKRPAPALAGIDWPVDGVAGVLTAGGDKHAGVLPYTPDQLSRADLVAMLAWLKQPHQPPADTYTPPQGRDVTILAFEKNGKPMTGADGLIQLIVGADEAAGRYSHWVSAIEVVPARR